MLPLKKLACGWCGHSNQIHRAAVPEPGQREQRRRGDGTVHHEAKKEEKLSSHEPLRLRDRLAKAEKERDALRADVDGSTHEHDALRRMGDLLKPQLAKEHRTSADALRAASDRLTEVEEEAEDREA